MKTPIENFHSIQDILYEFEIKMRQKFLLYYQQDLFYFIENATDNEATLSQYRYKDY